MIKDKTTGNIVSNNTTNSKKKNTTNNGDVTNFAEMPNNGIIDIHNAIKEILQGVRWKYNDKRSEKIFRTVKTNTGQYEFIVTGDSNPMQEIAFPAALISFINIRWTLNQASFNEGTAEMRIQLIMNTLNNMDDDKETEMYYVSQRVIQTIQEEKYKYPALFKQCKITFMDTATSYHSGLQSCWLTFAVKFVELSVWVERKTVRRFVVAPPFTNHSDQEPESNQFNHTDIHHPRQWEEATGFVDKVEET